MKPSIGSATLGTQQAQEMLTVITAVITGKIFRAVQTEGGGYYKTESLELADGLPINTFIFTATVDRAA